MPLRHENLQRAYRLMHSAGLTTDSIADEICTARSYVSRCITGHERAGGTWQRIRRVLELRGLTEVIDLLETMPLPETGHQVTEVRAKALRRAQVIPFAGIPKNHSAAPTVRRFSQWREEKAHA